MFPCVARIRLIFVQHRPQSRRQDWIMPFESGPFQSFGVPVLERLSSAELLANGTSSKAPVPVICPEMTGPVDVLEDEVMRVLP